MTCCAVVPLVTFSPPWTGLGALAPTVWLQTIMLIHQSLKGTSLCSHHPSCSPVPSCSLLLLLCVVHFSMVKLLPAHSTHTCCTLLLNLLSYLCHNCQAWFKAATIFPKSPKSLQESHICSIFVFNCFISKTIWSWGILLFTLIKYS